MNDTSDTTDFSDSDDELLGLNNDPVPTRKFYNRFNPRNNGSRLTSDNSSVIVHSNSYSNKKSSTSHLNIKENDSIKFDNPHKSSDSQRSDSKSSENDGWIYIERRKSRKYKSTPTVQYIAPSHNNSSFHNNSSSHNNSSKDTIKKSVKNKNSNNSPRTYSLKKSHSFDKSITNQNNKIQGKIAEGGTNSTCFTNTNNRHDTILLENTNKYSSDTAPFILPTQKFNDYLEDTPWNNILKTNMFDCNHEEFFDPCNIYDSSDSNESKGINEIFVGNKGQISPRDILMENHDGILPSMELIKTDQKSEKINRYQRMKEIHNVIGFVVNIHDATNYDIDLDISPELHEKYRDVISNQYTYKDLGNNFITKPDFSKLNEIIPEVGTTYRCRLRGVGINQLPQFEHIWRSNLMCVDVKQLIDRTDGWVFCTLSDIDVYQRLLVDIIIFTCNGPINLKEYLLSKMENEENPIFFHYSGKRERTLSH